MTYLIAYTIAGSEEMTYRTIGVEADHALQALEFAAVELAKLGDEDMIHKDQFQIIAVHPDNYSY